MEWEWTSTNPGLLDRCCHVLKVLEYDEDEGSFRNMKKMMPAVVAVMLLLVCLTGCGKYSSSFSATILVSSNTSGSSYMSFSSFSGTKTFKMNCKSGSDGVLEYSAKLETGSATVYYDDDGTKTELFTIKGGEEVRTSTVPVSNGTVYVIVETNEKCKEGRFDFAVR